MKKLFTPPLLAALLCCMGAFLIASCSDDDEKWPSEVSQPFVSVTAADGDATITAVISDADKTITFGEFQNMTDLSKVTVTFDMTWGAILKTPGTATAEVNLTSPYSVVVNVGYLHEETYLMSAKPKDIPNPILSAKVGNEEAVIAGNTITIAYKTGMNVNAMVFDIELVPGASLKSPENKTFDLEFADGTLVVTYGGTDYTYVVKQTGYTDPLLSQGWTDETGSFGTLPKYIKVYKTTKLNGVDNNIAYIAIMGPRWALSATAPILRRFRSSKVWTEAGTYTWSVYLLPVPQFRPSSVTDSSFRILMPSIRSLRSGRITTVPTRWPGRRNSTVNSMRSRSGTAAVSRLGFRATVPCGMPRRLFPESRWFCGTVIS